MNLHKLKLAFSHDLHIEVVEIWGEKRIKNGKPFDFVCVAYRGLSGDKTKKVYMTAAWSDVGRKLIDHIENGQCYMVLVEKSARGFNEWVDVVRL